MTAPLPRVLIAGLGNVFLGDDAFGVEVVRRLAVMPVPADVRLVETGIRSIHLAYELRERPYDAVILIDIVSNGGEAGTLYVLELEHDEDARNSRVADGHAVHPHDIVALVRQLGGRVGRITLVGCEPLRTGPDAGLSPPVAAALDGAVELVMKLAAPATSAAAVGRRLDAIHVGVDRMVGDPFPRIC